MSEETRRHLDAAISAALRPQPDLDTFVRETSAAAASQVAERIVGRRYWFASAPDLAPCYAVAMRSVGSHDWAAYIAGVSMARAEGAELAVQVARFGAKLDETAARAMFPDVDLPYRK